MNVNGRLIKCVNTSFNHNLQSKINRDLIRVVKLFGKK